MPNVLDSSTVITPSLPTLSTASAMTLPISGSAAEMAPTSAICALESTSLDWLRIASTASSTARSMPRFSDIGLAPAATLRRPSFTIACASTVAVVVPSPATSSVFLATSFTSSAPTFSSGSSSSISLAIETPSLVMVGAPHFFSRTTLRPLGPSVILTALASWSMPRSKARRASSSNEMIFAAIPSSSSGFFGPVSQPALSTASTRRCRVLTILGRRVVPADKANRASAIIHGMTDPPAWQRRFSAAQVGFPAWSASAADRLAFVSNESGSWQAWMTDRSTGERRQLSNEPVGVEGVLVAPDGRVVWWRDDTGDERGRWVAVPFEGGEAEPLGPGLPRGWAAGISFADGIVALGVVTDEEYLVIVAERGSTPAGPASEHEPARAWGGWTRPVSGGLSADGRLVCIRHTEHGDIVHHGLMVLDATDGTEVAQLVDRRLQPGPGRVEPAPG